MKIFLSPMTQDDYDKFYFINKDDIVSSLTSRGMSTEDSLLKFENMWQSLAPEGFTDKKNYFLNIFAKDECHSVGYIWLTERFVGPNRYAFLSSIMIFQEFRRQGYGTMAMKQLEFFVKKIGIKELRFQVDGDNEIAYRMYKKLDYLVTAHLMRKEL